mmetsp:Transcript_13249/g.18344  ORF Transcript_13249/g.18344 Transcript_13249/m.18344 type:complete len:153 (-) Transcript_13249:1130-1588(-)
MPKTRQIVHGGTVHIAVSRTHTTCTSNRKTSYDDLLSNCGCGSTYRVHHRSHSLVLFLTSSSSKKPSSRCGLERGEYEASSRGLTGEARYPLSPVLPRCDSPALPRWGFSKEDIFIIGVGVEVETDRARGERRSLLFDFDEVFAISANFDFN